MELRTTSGMKCSTNDTTASRRVPWTEVTSTVSTWLLLFTSPSVSQRSLSAWETAQTNCLVGGHLASSFDGVWTFYTQILLDEPVLKLESLSAHPPPRRARSPRARHAELAQPLLDTADLGLRHLRGTDGTRQNQRAEGQQISNR